VKYISAVHSDSQWLLTVADAESYFDVIKLEKYLTLNWNLLKRTLGAKGTGLA
jgi:hypothetical protein